MNQQLCFLRDFFLSMLFLSSCLASVLHADDAVIPRTLPTQMLNRLSLNSINRYYRNVYSQSGEDGIIEEIFRRLGVGPGFFVEFGGVDGIWFTNTRYLWEKGWSGAIIEGDDAKFKQLLQFYPSPTDQRVLCLHNFVAWNDVDSRGQTFDQIADTFFPGKEIDFLSMSVDGADYLILESLKRRPKVICIEAGLHWHPLYLDRIPDEYATQNMQQPLAVLIQIAEQKGYRPLCMTGNLFLIRSDLWLPFQDAPTDVLTLWRDGWRSSFCRNWLIRYRKYHPFIERFEGVGLQARCPITADF